MLESILAFWNQNTLLSWIVVVILSVAVSRFVKQLFRSVAKREAIPADMPEARVQTPGSPQDEHLCEFYILTEPEQDNATARADFVSGMPHAPKSRLAIGFVQDNEWVTVPHNTFEMVIGSGEHCQIRLPEKRGVLEEHLLILHQEDEFMLIPKGKLTMGGEKISEPVSLKHDAIIRIGNYDLELYYSEDA